MSILQELNDLFNDRSFTQALHEIDPAEAKRLKDFISRYTDRYPVLYTCLWDRTDDGFHRKTEKVFTPFDIELDRMYRPTSLTRQKDRRAIRQMFKAEAQLLYYDGIDCEDHLTAACLRLLSGIKHKHYVRFEDVNNQALITLTDFNEWIREAADYISLNAPDPGRPAQERRPFDIPEPIRPVKGRHQKLQILTAVELYGIIGAAPEDGLTFDQACRRFTDKTGYSPAFFRKLLKNLNVKFMSGNKRGPKSGRWQELIQDNEWALDCNEIEDLVYRRWDRTGLDRDYTPSINTIKHAITIHRKRLEKPAIPAAPETPSQAPAVNAPAAPDMKMPDIEYGRPAFDINDISLNAAPGPQAPPAFNPAFEEFLKEASAPDAPVFGDPDLPVLPAAPDNK
jgi:hypothetical protein